MLGRANLSKPELPSSVATKITELSSKFNIKAEDLKKQYWEIFKDPFIQSDPQFTNNKDRHAYAIRVLWVRIAAQPPTKGYIVIPFGIREPRTAKSSGITQSRIYVMVKGLKKRLEKKVIVCKGAFSGLCNDVRLFHAYKTELSAFTTIFFASSKTKFTNPKPLPVEPTKFLVEHVGASPIKIAKTPYKPSKKDKTGRYTDEFDLRLIKGIVLRYNKGKRADGSDWAVYTVSDESIGKERVTPNGKIIPSQFTVWVPSSMMKYDTESELLFLGTVSLTAEKEPQMNAIAVIPIHAKPIEGG